MEVRGRRALHAADGQAVEAGLAPGMAVTDARAIAPNLTLLDADPAAEAHARSRLADWCGRYSPWVADGGAEFGGGAGLWLDIQGCAHLFGGEAGLRDDLLARLEAGGFTARAAIADTPGAAWAIARFAAPDQDQVVSPGEQRQALAPLPIAALRLPADIASDLGRLGLRRIGDLYDLPRGAVTQRFATRLLHRLDEALGAVAEPISPRQPAEVYTACRQFAEPIGRPEDIAAALDLLLDDLQRQLTDAGQGARRLDFACYRVDGDVAHVRVGTGRPARDRTHLARLFGDRLGLIDPGFGIEIVRLTATATQAFATPQAGLAVAGGEKAAGAPDLPARDALLDRLLNRLGRKNVYRLAVQESHWPERAWTAVPAATAATARTWPAADPEQAPRPPRLLPRPEPVDAIAADPASPPTRFRWRRQTLDVARAQGPERLAPEWWRALDDFNRHRPTPPPGHPTAVSYLGGREGVWAGTDLGEAQKDTRDYYCVEVVDGRRFWLYRAPSPTAPTSRWFVHGVFG